MNSPKYNRTYHLPWSPGATNDDKIAKDIGSLLNTKIVITEKIDGSNVSLENNNCYARTHSAAPSHLSFDNFKAMHANIKHLIPENIQIFGEWCYALHSIPYDKLPAYFLLFNIRDLSHEGYWYSWSELEEWAKKLGVYTVPLLFKGIIKNEAELREIIQSLTKQPSELGTIREGVVIRVEDTFLDKNFSKNVMKWVRKNHVQTSTHWKEQKIIRNKLRT